jgi:hypothetical protein
VCVVTAHTRARARACTTAHTRHTADARDRNTTRAKRAPAHGAPQVFVHQQDGGKVARMLLQCLRWLWVWQRCLLRLLL